MNLKQFKLFSWCKARQDTVGDSCFHGNDGRVGGSKVEATFFSDPDLSAKPCRHLAIIMDGNGRWAKQKSWPRHFGHLRGVKALRQTVKDCSALSIPYLTVFAFSTENWKRPSQEVSWIFQLMERSLNRYKKELDKNQVRLHVLGDIQQLDTSVRNIFINMIEHTKNNRGLNLILAVNYGGRKEIVEAVRNVSQKVQAGEMTPKDITEESFARCMPSSRFPPPDMIIRTGAQSRLSNFYLWGSAYAEIYVSPVLWPDFNTAELNRALKHYQKTHRRFGAL